MAIKLEICAILLGLVLLGYSLTLEPFTDSRRFEFEYRSLRSGQSAEFHQLRESLLTPKFRLQDMGITFIALPACLLLLRVLGRGRIMSPPNKLVLLAISISLPVLSSVGYLFDLLQIMDRQEVPHWADSVGVPLMGVFPFFFILLIWSFTLFCFTSKVRSGPIAAAFTRQLNPLIIVVSAVTVLLLLDSLYFGYYWYAVPGALWLYYYLSLGLCWLPPNG